jgi:hypothetical protein
MSDKVAIFIVSFNMPERTDALVEHIQTTVKWPFRLFVIDNGSDIVQPSQYSNVFIKRNRQTTAGWLAGLDAADKYREDYLGYWFLITSAEFTRGDADPLTSLAELLVEDNNAVGVHPALTTDSTTAWKHMITVGGKQPRQVDMIDNIASLWRADWFNQIGRFDPELIYAWGIDLETCHKAREQGRSLWVHEGSRIKKVTNIGYKMNRMNMTAGDREQKAWANMAQVFERKYGNGWYDLMYGWRNG